MHKLGRRAGFIGLDIIYARSGARYIAHLLSEDRCCNRSINRAAKRIDIACLPTYELGNAALEKNTTLARRRRDAPETQR